MINEDDSQSRGSVISDSPVQKLSPVKLLNDSWFEEVNSSEQTNENQRNKSKDITEETNMDYSDLTAIKSEYAAGIVKKDKDTNNDSSINTIIKKTEPQQHNKSAEFEIEFFDSTNEAKFERLVKDQKIKTTFKRRLSGNSNDDSRSSSPSIGNNNGETSMAEDTTTKFYNSSKEGNKFFKNHQNHSDSKKPRYENQRNHSSNSGGSSESGSSTKKWMKPVPETNPEILERRQKQIDYGKNTIGYDNYLKQVPKSNRTKNHPWTPPKNVVYSRRAWDGLIKLWRKELHVFDIDGGQPKSNNNHNNSSSDSSDDDDNDNLIDMKV